MTAVEIVPYKKEFANYFYDLNSEWLKTFFYVEPFDEEVLRNPEKYIINKGGFIFFAKLNSKIIGTVALMPMENTSVLELTKMAVSPTCRGQKVGQTLMQYVIDFAKNKSLNALELYSNSKLENAIYIYKKYGFIEVDLESNSPYKRSDIKMRLEL